MRFFLKNILLYGFVLIFLSSCSYEVRLPVVPSELAGEWALMSDPEVKVIEFRREIDFSDDAQPNMLLYVDESLSPKDPPSGHLIRILNREIQSMFINPTSEWQNEWQTFCYSYKVEDGILTFDNDTLSLFPQGGQQPFDDKRLVRIGHGRIPEVLWGEWKWETDWFSVTITFKPESISPTDSRLVCKTMSIKTEAHFFDKKDDFFGTILSEDEYHAMDIRKRIDLFNDNPYENPSIPSRNWCEHYILQRNNTELIFLGGIAEELTNREPFVLVKKLL